jgi:transcriptional regulator with XRE-family HTH domain
MDALEERTGVSKRTISEIERGMRIPQTLTLAKLANALGVDLDELVEDEARKAPAPPPEDGERGSKEKPEEQGSPQATFDAEALGRALASQWRAALDDLEETKARRAIYGGQLLRLAVEAHKTRVGFEAAAQGGYANRPEFRETLRLMDRALSAVKAEAKEYLDGVTAEMAEGFVRDFERQGTELDAH